MDILIKNARIVNEGETFESDLLIKNRRYINCLPQFLQKITK